MPANARRAVPSPAGPYPARELGGGDHDAAYRFGRPATYPWSIRERVRLLLLRARLPESLAERSYE